ncbi:MAG: hypothetical protein GX217_08870 [Clostridiaceae bacterium]|nr:hypothetical protein [Clostridiaceae bacterium]
MICSQTEKHIQILTIRQKSQGIWYKIVKCALDVMVPVVCLIVAFSLMLLIELTIKGGDGGPIFYKQLRLTKEGR